MTTFFTSRSNNLNYIFQILTLLMSFEAAGQGKYNGKNIGEFDQYVDKVRKEWNVPGLSIVVVKDNHVIFKKGYGVRELGRPEPVDTQTLFACASTTKAMTVALLGMLVDEGRLDWDDKVYKYLPELQFPDPYVTREMSIRDLLIHNSGIGGTDFLTGIMNIPANEMFKRIALVRPSYSFRGGFEYQNIMYAAAGRIIERLTGKLWSDVMMERIFTPLGMTTTVPKRKFATTRNMTKPHYNVDDTIRVLAYGGDSEIGSAGAVWSNVDDMSKWVICMMDSSRYSGGRLLSPATWSEIFKPQNFFPMDEYPTMQLLKPNWMTYGLGWYQHDYKGHKVNFHTGSLSGLIAITGHIPDQKLGVYVFGNYDHAEVRHVLMYKVFDWFALGETRDWNKEFKELYDGIANRAKKVRSDFEANRMSGTTPSSALPAYAGKYISALYGETVVTVDGEQLNFEVNKVVKISLPHWHFDTFYGRSKRGTGASVTATFQLTENGKVNVLIFNGMKFKRAGS